MKLTLLIIYSFILGSIPFGLIIARMKGIDPRKVGSGNIGATNILRSAGRMAGILTLLGDSLKGVAAVAIGRALGVGAFYEGILGISAIAGHNFSLFLGFRGGKGVATSLGAVLIYMPQAGMIAIAIWLLVALITRYSSLGALVTFAFLPLIAFMLGEGREKIVIAGIISLFIFIRHIGNIKRLLKGTERGFGEKI
ncbi:MAG: glycerol-3-phosphate 1-O-acyltransferase PlsY [Nitrospirae bacterium]|nr:glycerol-3-phosphate 1-O-acyltransferase PlsY [Nitrospirota bacterium]